MLFDLFGGQCAEVMHIGNLLGLVIAVTGVGDVQL